MDPVYIEKIQKWVQLDNKYADIQKKITALQDEMRSIQEQNKPLIESRDELEKDITEYVQSSKMDMLTINTSDGSIKFTKRNTTQVLSLKILKVLLTSYKNDTDDTSATSFDVDNVLNYVANNLEKKTKLGIKRTVQ